jgi:hypothetical protein
MLPESAKIKLQPDILDTNAVWGGYNKEYRYVLTRVWDKSLPKCVFIGLNPSVADESFDDRTVRRCIGFARREKCGTLVMLNAFAFRTTDSKMLLSCASPVGLNNDFYISQCCKKADLVIVGWGTLGKRFDRQEKILKLLKAIELVCLGVNSDGTPKHPLYLANNTQLVAFVG